MTKQTAYDYSKKETIDLTDMTLEEIWNIRFNLNKHTSLEIILDKIIKRLQKLEEK